MIHLINIECICAARNYGRFAGQVQCGRQRNALFGNGGNDVLIVGWLQVTDYLDGGVGQWDRAGYGGASSAVAGQSCNIGTGTVGDAAEDSLVGVEYYLGLALL